MVQDAELGASEEVLFRQWYLSLYALCYAKLSCATDAEDAVQETFLRLWRQHLGPGELKDVGAWLRSVASNVCIDIIRRRKVRRYAPLDADSHVSNGSSEVDEKDQRDFIHSIINTLPESTREVVLLHYYTGLSYDQMATWLSVSRSTVKARLRSARQLLRDRLESRAESTNEL